MTAKQNKITILLVDDFDPWRATVREMLNHPSCDIVGEACDGLEAIEKAVQLQPDIAIVDVGMPGMDGIEAARRIQERSRSAIVFLSQNTDAEVQRAALSIGHAFVLKNKAQSELVSAIERAQAAAASDRQSVAMRSRTSSSDNLN